MVQRKFNLKLDCWISTVYVVSFLRYCFFSKNLGSMDVDCCLRGVVFGCYFGFVSRLIRLYEGGLGYGRIKSF